MFGVYSLFGKLDCFIASNNYLWFIKMVHLTKVSKFYLIFIISNVLKLTLFLVS